MEFNWSILGWLAGLIFVYIFGLVEGRNQGYKKRKVEESTEKKNEPESKPVTVKVDDPGLLRIKNESGYWTLDLDGARVDTTAFTVDQRKRLIEMLNLMRPWLEGRPIAASVPTPASAAQPKPVAPARPGIPVISTPPASQPVSRPSPSSSPAQPIAPKTGTIAPEDRPIAPAGSIVSQIDSILQTHIVGTPLEERGVFLAQSPEGGVIVYVGLTKYMGVDDVPDPQIKAAIRAAISEWENKYTPGL